MSNDKRNQIIEQKTDFDILNWDDFSIDIINRFGDDDDDVISIYIANKSISQIIKQIKNL